MCVCVEGNAAATATAVHDDDHHVDDDDDDDAGADDCCRILTASNQNAKAAEQTAQVERKWTQDIRAFKNYIYRHLSSIFYAVCVCV